MKTKTQMNRKKQDAGNQSRGVMSASKEIRDSSFMIFFVIAQIAFIAN